MFKGNYAVPVGRKKYMFQSGTSRRCANHIGVIVFAILYLKYPPFRQAIHKLIAGPLSTLAGALSPSILLLLWLFHLSYNLLHVISQITIPSF